MDQVERVKLLQEKHQKVIMALERARTKREVANTNHEALQAKLKEDFGISPEQIEDRIEELTKELDTTLNSVEEKLNKIAL